jgi:hypothetical protein
VPFNFRLFFRLTYLSLFASRGTHTRLTRKRVVFLLAFYALFVPWQLVNWIFFLLDDVFFPAYRRVEVRAPVFIVGNPRSGSTHLMRVLARDEKTFACAKLWEVLLAPAITQRKMARALLRLDRRLGSPIRRWLIAWQERAFQGLDKYHRVRLEKPEEDELTMVPVFCAIHFVFPFPFLDEFVRYVYFDTQVPLAERKRFMAFYRRAMQRTLYLYGPRKHLLSKSPAHSGRVGALAETFPDARFIYTLRDPAAVLPSTMSLFSYQWRAFSDPLEAYPFRDYMVEMTRHWYRYPLRRLEEACKDRYVVVEYDDLVADLQETVAQIYAGLGFDMSPAYVRVLEKEAERARRYESEHRYSLEAIGLTREQIRAEYEDILERFGYETT